MLINRIIILFPYISVSTQLTVCILTSTGRNVIIERFRATKRILWPVASPISPRSVEDESTLITSTTSIKRQEMLRTVDKSDRALRLKIYAYVYRAMFVCVYLQDRGWLLRLNGLRWRIIATRLVTSSVIREKITTTDCSQVDAIVGICEYVVYVYSDMADYCSPNQVRWRVWKLQTIIICKKRIWICNNVFLKKF